ncbi:MAG: UDP-N-acetylmuramate--L-alanine ligase [Leptospirales bacterium]
MWNNEVKSLHFVGIGGNGMAPIAEILLARGVSVTGSDQSQTELTRRLSELGAHVFVGHRAEQVGEVDAVIISTAIRQDNPELLEAKRRGLPVVHRGEALARLMNGELAIAVAGSHGKTTTTSMIGAVLIAGGMDPTCVVGGSVPGFGGNARIGKRPCFVAEADESDGSFLRMSPTIAVVTNIDREHLDHYRSFEKLKEAFLSFMNSIPEKGMAVLCLDDPQASSLIADLSVPVLTYGFSDLADIVGKGIRPDGLVTSFSVCVKGEDWGVFTLNVPGNHNVSNALASIAVAFHLGIPADVVRDALFRFRGVGRRFTLVGEAGGIMIVDDYGHHPTEIEATLRAARQAYPERRIVVAFQPHRFSRTRDLLCLFAHAFGDADLLVLSEIYGAGEIPIEGITGERLYHEIQEVQGSRVLFAPDRNSLATFLVSRLEPGDLLLTMGAGDITCLGQELLSLINHPSRVVG